MQTIPWTRIEKKFTETFQIIANLIVQAVTGSSLEEKVCSSNLEPVKSDTVLLTAHHCCDISAKGAVLPGRNDTETGPANS